MQNQQSDYDMYGDFLKGQCERKAARYLARKQFERREFWKHNILFWGMATVLFIAVRISYLDAIA